MATSQLVRTALRAAKTAAIKPNTIGKVVGNVEKMGAEAVETKLLKPPKPKEAPTTNHPSAPTPIHPPKQQQIHTFEVKQPNRHHFESQQRFAHSTNFQGISSHVSPSISSTRGIGDLLVDLNIQGGITHSNLVVQRIDNKLIEKAPKTIKEFFSKMVEKVARINEEQAKNLIEKVKDTMDNVEKFQSSLNKNPTKPQKINTSEALLNAVSNKRKEKKNYDDDLWLNEDDKKMKEKASGLIEKIYEEIGKSGLKLEKEIDSNVSNSILEILKKHGKRNEGEMTKDEIEQIFKLFEGMGFDEKQKNGLGSIKEIFDGYLDNAKNK
uniref:EF-hand domain-containing protein n=1 Tax=Meloidogyne floridensis TaxID=298350 RepID=A0A915PAX9_9BILA